VYIIALCAEEPSRRKSAEIKLFVSSETLPKRIDKRQSAKRAMPSRIKIADLLVFTVKILR
jgi:hypothetical protein